MSPGCVLYHIRVRGPSADWLRVALRPSSSTRVDMNPKVQPPPCSLQEEAPRFIRRCWLTASDDTALR